MPIHMTKKSLKEICKKLKVSIYTCLKTIHVDQNELLHHFKYHNIK